MITRQYLQREHRHTDYIHRKRRPSATYAEEKLLSLTLDSWLFYDVMKYQAPVFRPLIRAQLHQTNHPSHQSSR